MSTTVESLIAQIPPERREQFSPTRYPYTYACDFIRQNLHVVPAEVAGDESVADYFENGLMSRAQASRVRQVWAQVEGREDEELARVLADAFMQVHGIVRPEED